MSQKNELGKGLRALLSNINTDQSQKSVAPASTAINTINIIPIDQIVVNKQQPRHVFEEELITELSESIKTYGLIQPLTVRKINVNEYQIISGERRFRASQLAGLKELPVYIRTANDNEMLELALVENIQREDLNPIEIGISYQRLSDECGYTQEQLSERIGKKRSTISNYVRLLKLPLDIQAALKNKTLSMGHARVIAGVDDLIVQMQLFKDIQAKDLSVRETERAIQSFAKASARRPLKSPPTNSNAQIKTLEDRLSAKFGYKVQIKRNATGEGQIIIKFKDDRQLNDLLDR
ncbi:MAG TPA: ParB/RepB/Spo0J family partition protein, partial [Saprospiraceae bacterium]|nr:ParB/RepB/Spo0J family partition protein [Saprospiraceae bacterium]